MNIELLREELELNRKYLEDVKIYLAKADGFFNTKGQQEKQHYTGFLTVKDNPLVPILATLQLIEKSGKTKEGEDYTIKAGNFNLKPTATFDESEPAKIYGNTFESKETKKLRQHVLSIPLENGKPVSGFEAVPFDINQVNINNFDLVLFGEKVLSFPLSGFVIKKTGNFCLTFSDYSIESYEIAQAKDEANNTDYSTKVLEYSFEPLKAGWSWEDLAAFAETQLAEHPKFEEFIKENFSSSGYEARKLKLSLAAQIILNKVQARKSGVSQLNAKQKDYVVDSISKAAVTQGQIDLAKVAGNLSKSEIKAIDEALSAGDLSAEEMELPF